MSRKGQMFLIAAVLLVIGFMMVKNLLAVYNTIEEKRYGEYISTDKQLKNILAEYKAALGIGSVQSDPTVMNDYLANFTSYVKNDFDTEIFFFTVIYDNATDNITVFIANYLGDSINGSVNGTDMTPAGYDLSLSDGTNTTEVFTADADSSNITVVYSFRGTQRTEEVVITTQSDKNSANSFFDVKIKEKDIVVRKKDTYNRTW